MDWNWIGIGLESDWNATLTPEYIVRLEAIQTQVVSPSKPNHTDFPLTNPEYITESIETRKTLHMHAAR